MTYRGWGWGWGMGWGGGLFMCLVGILFIALVIMIIVRLIRHGHGGYHSTTMSSTKQTPLDIAKERYAKGEITKEQFDQIKKDLS